MRTSIGVLMRCVRVYVSMNENYPSHNRIKKRYSFLARAYERRKRRKTKLNHAYMKPTVLFILSICDTKRTNTAKIKAHFCMGKFITFTFEILIFFSLILTLWKRGSKDEKKNCFFLRKGKKILDSNRELCVNKWRFVVNNKWIILNVFWSSRICKFPSEISSVSLTNSLNFVSQWSIFWGVSPRFTMHYVYILFAFVVSHSSIQADSTLFCQESIILTKNFIYFLLMPYVANFEFAEEVFRWESSFPFLCVRPAVSIRLLMIFFSPNNCAVWGQEWSVKHEKK